MYCYCNIIINIKQHYSAKHNIINIDMNIQYEVSVFLIICLKVEKFKF